MAGVVFDVVDLPFAGDVFHKVCNAFFLAVICVARGYGGRITVHRSFSDRETLFLDILRVVKRVEIYCTYFTLRTVRILPDKIGGRFSEEPVHAAAVGGLE